MEHTLFILMILIPVVAFLYASVGHGGASSYLALLSLFRFPPEQIRPSALLMNIAVSGIAFLLYRKACVFPVKLFLTLTAFSVPASFIGGALLPDAALYQTILGILLLFPIMRLFRLTPVRTSPICKRKIWMAPALGLSIGFISGLIGIGGGILLSPVLLLLVWTNVKETAAISALFIFLNSISGFMGAFDPEIIFDDRLYLLAPLAVCGGLLGSYYGAHRFRLQVLRYLLGFVLLIASVKFICS